MSWRRFALCKDKFRLCWLTLFIWMFLLDCCWLSGVKFTSLVSWMAIDSQTEVLALKIFVGYIPLLLFRKWSKTGTEACYRDTNFKRTLISSPRFSEAIRVLNSDWRSDSIMNGHWLYFSHVKNAIRKPDWTYRFFFGENIAHIEFYLQGLLPKILPIYTIKNLSFLTRTVSIVHNNLELFKEQLLGL